MKQRALVVGSGAREAALAWRLAETHTVDALIAHENPSIVEIVHRTGGKFRVGDYCDGAQALALAKEARTNLAIVSNDAALAGGVVDSLLAGGIRTVGPSRNAAEIEWNKSFGRSLVTEFLPNLNPEFWIARTSVEIDHAICVAKEKGLAVVVKPQGLTSGRGVKVMGDHFADYAAAAAYARQVLVEHIGGSNEVIIEEKLEGVEFTVQAITDGKSLVRVPVTYDFPYRFDGDTGPGTGGMGSICGPGQIPNFLSAAEYEECLSAIETVLKALSLKGLRFNGVLNTGFFATPKGLKIMEFNARFGDPECMNILMLLETPFSSLLNGLLDGNLESTSVKFKPGACVVRYLVPREYCIAPATPQKFGIDLETVKRIGAEVFFGSAIAKEAGYITIGASRSLALATYADTLREASELIDSAIGEGVSGALDFRKDIGSEAYMEKLVAKRSRRKSH